MKLSYKWLREYLPEDAAFAEYIEDAHKLADILTAVGLEVEGLEEYESVKGGLKGLVVGAVKTCVQHPNADRLKVTTVDTGSEIVQIVCGAPNVAAGQKVVVAQPGTVLYPVEGDSFKIKKSKIRGEESLGMLCAEDEIGLGSGHDGIIVLPENTDIGQPVANVLPVYSDYLIEIGLTPNRMDGQSHLGAAKDICAWLSYHTGKKAKVKSPLGKNTEFGEAPSPVTVEVKDTALASRYSGIVINDITISSSPAWMQNRLKVIGVRPINNIVDITNYILHTTGQPLHAFDADRIKGNKVIVATLPEGTTFVSLDEKERKLSADDIMICDGENNPMCIGGVFGGLDSGVSENTKNIFLESAVFEPVHIRKSMIRHDLRTDAASRFEKGVDQSKTVEVLRYAAALIKELGDGKLNSAVVDIFNQPPARIVRLRYDYLRKLSGRTFDVEDVANLLISLNYVVKEKDEHSITVIAPESNPDVSIQADVVEDILRISGLDHIPISQQIKMTPGIDEHPKRKVLEEKISAWLVGNGFSEIFTNSLTNENYSKHKEHAVKILNSLTRDLTVLRQDMLPTALEAVSYNINRQNKNLFFFEFGKTYHAEDGQYSWVDHLAIYASGEYSSKSWISKSQQTDLFYMKGVAGAIFKLMGIVVKENSVDNHTVSFEIDGRPIGFVKQVDGPTLNQFDIKQPVYYLDFLWDSLVELIENKKIKYRPIPKFPSVSRDLSMILDDSVLFGNIKETILGLQIRHLTDIKMFDLYKNDRLGKNKKSMALSFSFLDEQKTLTDKETDKMMQKIIQSLQKKYQAEIRDHA